MPTRTRTDYGHRYADRELYAIEKKLKRVYDRAYASMKKEADKFFVSFEVRESKMLKKLESGEITQEKFDEWRENLLLKNTKYTKTVNSLAEEMTKTNQMARDITNGSLGDIYAENYNWEAFEIFTESGRDIRFDLVDSQTIERLIVEGDMDLLPNSIPTASIDIAKDLAWNKKKINETLTSSILRGDSVDKIAENLRQVTNMNESASVRNARTMVTAAENGGRQDRMTEAVDKYGIEMKKTWLATLDARTRDAHADLDGQSVDVDKKFESALGKIEYPGDPTANPANVYNCRCTLIGGIKGFTRDYSRRQMSKGLKGMSYEEWKAEAAKRLKEKSK